MREEKCQYFQSEGFVALYEKPRPKINEEIFIKKDKYLSVDSGGVLPFQLPAVR